MDHSDKSVFIVKEESHLQDEQLDESGVLLVLLNNSQYQRAENLFRVLLQNIILGLNIESRFNKSEKIRDYLLGLEVGVHEFLE